VTLVLSFGATLVLDRKSVFEQEKLLA